VYSVILSSLVLGEMTTANQVIGAIIITIGFFIGVFDKRRMGASAVK
jgi:drug/metabolite transporter (DMT)-like permease